MTDDNYSIVRRGRDERGKKTRVVIYTNIVTLNQARSLKKKCENNQALVIEKYLAGTS